MKHTLELVFIIDQSGSMAGLEQDTIGGFNSIIEKQKQLHGDDVVVSTVLFNHESDVIHNRVPIQEVTLLDQKDYIVGGSTALLDAVGGSIEHIQRVHDLLGVSDAPSQTLVVITTDGQENSSRRYHKETIQNMVKARQEEGWEFIFLGANIDAFDQARAFGISKDRTSNYMHDQQGVQYMYDSLNQAVNDLRTSKRINKEWKEQVEKDYVKRSKKYGGQ
jgi:uncharacterized protein YegL